MTLKQLLQRWSELEPERCQYTEEKGDESPWYTINLDRGRAHIEYHRATQEDHALLQAIVQKVIESQGWGWSILFSAKSVYRAGVKVTESYISETARFSAYALLAAYLKALEVGKAQRV